MSAFICTDETFHYLLSAWRQSYTPSNMAEGDRDARTQAIGQMLIDANYASVNCRYNDNDQPETYAYDKRWDRVVIDAIQVLSAARCLDYQSCEFDGWDKSDAKRFLNDLVWDYAVHLPAVSTVKYGAPALTECKRRV